MDKMYSLNEIGLIPAIKSQIKSRKDVDIYTNGVLPIFVAPMTCILDCENLPLFQEHRVIPILPIHHNCSFEDRKRLSHLYWVSFTLQETKLLSEDESFYGGYVLIDCADGHLESLLEIAREFKKAHPYCLLMAGNIANPEVYYDYCKAGIDYVRVGIGGGSGCTTSVLSGFHASLPWLITEINNRRKSFKDEKIAQTLGLKTLTKIVADGGVNTIDKAIKCLALGADYVMMGKCFAECKEANPTTQINANQRKYYGQASIQGQMDRFGEVRSNPEGIQKIVTINGTLKDFTDKFSGALRTAFSYANATCLDEFIGKVQWKIQSTDEFNSYNK